MLPERHAHSECPASRKENLYVSNLALLEDGIAGRGSVQFRHRSNLGIASCNKASTSGVRYSVIERVRIDAKDATKWADCQRQWNKQKDEGRKNWPSLYKCMTN